VYPTVTAATKLELYVCAIHVIYSHYRTKLIPDHLGIPEHLNQKHL